MLFLVSSAAIKSTLFKVFNTRNVISSKFPIGVAHKYNIPAIFLSSTFSCFLPLFRLDDSYIHVIASLKTFYLKITPIHCFPALYSYLSIHIYHKFRDDIYLHLHIRLKVFQFLSLTFRPLSLLITPYSALYPQMDTPVSCASARSYTLSWSP